MPIFRRTLIALLLMMVAMPVVAERGAWRQASSTELAALLPARAPVEREHIETEMRTASGIVNAHGRYVAGVVLLTAGYSADGKYSHYLLVQAAVRIGGINLLPGSYLIGYARSGTTEALNVRIHEASSGNLVGTTEAHLLTGIRGISSLRIWPPSDRSVIQIGRFGIPYEVEE